MYITVYIYIVLYTNSRYEILFVVFLKTVTCSEKEHTAAW